MITETAQTEREASERPRPDLRSVKCKRQVTEVYTEVLGDCTFVLTVTNGEDKMLKVTVNNYGAAYIYNKDIPAWTQFFKRIGDGEFDGD